MSVDIDQCRTELIAAVDHAKHLCLDHGITTVLQVHGDPACPCTIQYNDPEHVHLWIGFTCPRHGGGANFLLQELSKETP